jgi:hypothetical protein
MPNLPSYSAGASRIPIADTLAREARNDALAAGRFVLEPAAPPPDIFWLAAGSGRLRPTLSKEAPHAPICSARCRSAALTLGLLAVAPAWAQPTRSTRSVAASPVVIQNLGRRLISTNLESGASVQCSAQGQLVDTNGNGIADSLRGRAACLENRGVARLRLY